MPNSEDNCPMVANKVPCVTRMVCMAVLIKLPYRTDHTYHRMVNNCVKQGPKRRPPWEGGKRNVSQFDKQYQYREGHNQVNLEINEIFLNQSNCV